MKRVAVVRACALGDAVQCTPLLQQIKADEPAAHVSFFTSPNATLLFEHAAFVDEVIPLQARWLSIRAGRRGMLRAWWEVARHSPFDVMISLESTWLRNAGLVLVQAPVKAGLSFTEGRKLFQPFTHPLHLSGDSRQMSVHASKQYLDLWLNIRGTPDRGFGYDMRHLLSLQPRTRRICIAPGTGNAFSRIDTKQWPVRNFIELGRRLAAQGHEVAFVGGAGDLEGEAVPSGCADWLGKTSLREIANVLHTSAAMVGNDSGLFHLAQAVDCPALGLFGPTRPEFTGIFRCDTARTLQATLPCVPCYQARCHADHSLPRPCCMSALSVDRVMNALTELL